MISRGGGEIKNPSGIKSTIVECRNQNKKVFLFFVFCVLFSVYFLCIFCVFSVYFLCIFCVFSVLFFLCCFVIHSSITMQKSNDQLPFWVFPDRICTRWSIGAISISMHFAEYTFHES